jgi:MYXO-CTERM domain-containing protein
MLALSLLALISPVHARPTEGGRWGYTDTDTVTSLEGATGRVRVWYSTAGPNAVKAGDADADGLPDFAEEVAETTEAVLDRYEQVGFRLPIADGTRGGDALLDVYLVDFGGSADGNWASEACDAEGRCSGYFTMENDFAGYGYGSDSLAIRVLTSHELFHGVQAAYDSGEPVWFSEGTATWAEALFDPESADFVAFCDAYLEDTGRSLDRPPSGPVPTFAYATALWWWFLSDRHGTQFMVDLLESTDGADGVLPDMEALESAAGSSLRQDWTTFASWNLATGPRAGAADSYPFARRIGPVRYEADGATIDDENRFYPLATTYYRLDHPGGPLTFATAPPAPELAFALHAEDADGAVLPALATWDGSAPQDFGDLAAGRYWLVGSNPTRAEDSTRVRACLGADATACVESAVVDDTGGDTGDTATTEDASEGGCGCVTPGGAGPSGSALVVAAGLVGVLARRRGTA